VDLSVSWGGGGLVSTAQDMAKLVKGYATGSFLSEATRARVLSTFNPMHGKTALTYGYGITRMDIDGTILLGTTGEGVGFANAAFYDPQTGTTIVVFTNVFSEAIEETLTEVVRALR